MRSRPSSVLLGVAAWVVAVAVAATVAWVAVDRAGQQVVDTPALADALDAVATTAAGGGSPTPTRTAVPTRRPSTSPPRSSAASPPASAPTSAPPPATRPARPAQPTSRTWRLPEGQLSVRCSGSQVSLSFAVPANGWSVRTKDAGPAEVEVEFRRDGGDGGSGGHGGGGDDQRTYTAVCSAGTATLGVDR